MLGKKAGPVLPDSTTLSRSGCLWLLQAAVHQREAMLTACFTGPNARFHRSKYSEGQRSAASAIVKVCCNSHTGARIRHNGKQCKPHCRPGCFVAVLL